MTWYRVTLEGLVVFPIKAAGFYITEETLVFQDKEGRDCYAFRNWRFVEKAKMNADA